MILVYKFMFLAQRYWEARYFRDKSYFLGKTKKQFFYGIIFKIPACCGV
jgi:hypothetical protein